MFAIEEGLDMLHTYFFAFTFPVAFAPGLIDVS